LNKALLSAVAALLIFIGGFLLGRSSSTPSPPALASNFADQAHGDMADKREERAFVTKVIDGDTVELENGERVRYLGIDTPEVASNDCYASEATNRNRELVEGREVTLISEDEDRDRFGRLLRWLWLDDGTFVNAELVSEGYAHSFFFGDSRYRQVLVQLEVGSKLKGLGGWQACSWP
jgi:endonuclease YncB( thermonuclease family)